VLLDAEFYVQSKNIFIGSASLILLLFALFVLFFSGAETVYCPLTDEYTFSCQLGLIALREQNALL